MLSGFEKFFHILNKVLQSRTVAMNFFKDEIASLNKVLSQYSTVWGFFFIVYVSTSIVVVIQPEKLCNRQSKECQVFRDGELKKLTILSGMFPVLLLSVCVPYRTIFLALPAIVSCININALVELCFKRDSVIVPRGIFMVLMLSTTVLLAVTVLIGLVLIWTSYIYSMCRNSSSSKPSHLAVKEFIPLSTYKSHRTQVSTDPVIVSLQEDTVPP